MPHSISPRRLATSAQVHPKFLPYIHTASPLLWGSALRRVPVYVTVAGIGYALATYQAPQRTEAPLGVQDSHLSEERAALLDAYGGRESLEELEMAARVYSAQQQRRP